MNGWQVRIVTIVWLLVSRRLGATAISSRGTLRIEWNSVCLLKSVSKKGDFQLATDTQPVAAPAPAERGSAAAFWGLMVLLVAAAATLITLQARRPKPA